MRNFAQMFFAHKKKAALAALAPIDLGFSGPRRTVAVSTREAYPKHRRVVKSEK